MVWPPRSLPVPAPRAEPWSSSIDAVSDTPTAMARVLFRMGSPLGASPGRAWRLAAPSAAIHSPPGVHYAVATDSAADRREGVHLEPAIRRGPPAAHPDLGVAGRDLARAATEAAVETGVVQASGAGTRDAGCGVDSL